MSTNQESIETLNEIRNLMERSSKFLSLSGLSGVFAGVFAIIGASVAYIHFKTDWLTQILDPTGFTHKKDQAEIFWFLLVDGLLVLSLSLVFGILFTIRKAKKRGLVVWNGSSKRLLTAMIVPLAAGGIFCIAMMSYGLIWLIFPTSLIFYGIALVSAGRFTYREVHYLGMTEIIIGCLALFATSYAVVLWSIGFGLMHIIYGLAMHNKYDSEKAKSSAKMLSLLLVFGILFVGKSANAQSNVINQPKQYQKWYDDEVIYMQGHNSFVKKNVLYAGNKAFMREFAISPAGLDLYFRSKKNRNIGLTFSLLGAGATIYSLLSNDNNLWKKMIWVSLGTGLGATLLNVRANNQIDEAVWLRNKDAMILMEINQYKKD